MSIDVLAIALRRRGLCCETNAPTLKPLAQKLSSALFRQMGKSQSPLFTHPIYN